MHFVGWTAAGHPKGRSAAKEPRSGLTRRRPSDTPPTPHRNDPAIRENRSSAVRNNPGPAPSNNVRDNISLRRQDLNRDFHEPASLRAATSAQRSSSQRASAAPARARCCSYRAWKSCGATAGVDPDGDQIPSPPSASLAPAEKSSSRTAMRSTIAQVKSCYQPPCEASFRCR